MQQMNLFEVLHEPYKIKKPIRLIELFAGYGSQNLALKYLGADYEHHRICEWATKSIQAYNDLHIQDYTDYSKVCSFDEVVYYLHKKGISLNYNEPMTLEQIKRKGEEWCRTTYNNIIATHNLVNVQQVHGRDLDIYDTDSFTYLLTYSFPCQDLSLAGKRKGMEKDSGTRSGMLWEVERILNECASIGRLPQVLIMENVTQVHSKDNMPHFQAWIKALEKLGYSSYWKDLNAKDYGIPQNRDRTFMVSMLGNGYYEFSKHIPLKLRIKDMFEDNVDEKYYLSNEHLDRINNWKSFQNPLTRILGRNSISPTITTRIAISDGGGINASTLIYSNKLNETSNLKNKEYYDLNCRYYTPKDCFRLMGVKDEDYDKVAKNQSDSSLYHLAGDSLITLIIMALVGQMLDINWLDKYEPERWWNNEKSIQENDI